LSSQPIENHNSLKSLTLIFGQILTIKTNLYGYFHMAQACLPHMRAGPAIVNSGSVTALIGNSTVIDNTMTKGGIHAFTRALSGSLVPRGIRVNAVAPGPVWTPLNPSDNPSGMAEFGTNTRMKRPAQPEEIDPAYVFVVSKQMSSYITGEILLVIGGYTHH
jgi:NAD(P)-dependent dehydrogenase (short-subunit alcohol dehydrogenase family)